MKKQSQHLIFGILVGLLLGIAVTLATQRSHQRLSLSKTMPIADDLNTIARTASHHGGAGAGNSQTLVTGRDVDGARALADNPTNDFVAIRVTPSCSITFSAAFVQALRGLKAAGEPTDVVVNLVVAEFQRQWRDQVNAVNRKLRSGNFDFDESQEFFHNRNDALGEAVAALLGDDGFEHWNKQRLLRSAASEFVLTTAESDRLYRVEKQHEEHVRDLTQAREDGKLDPLDYNEQRKTLDDDYQKERAALLTQGRREVEGDNLIAGLKSETRHLNLSAQEFAELVQAARKNMEAEQELESAPKDASYADKRRVLDLAAESDLTRILGSQRFEDLKKGNDFRYQQMKQYQQLWQLSDGDITYLYQKFVTFDKSLEDHRIRAPQTLETTDAESKDSPVVQTDPFEHDARQQLETDLLQYLGEQRLQRFKAAGLVPQNE